MKNFSIRLGDEEIEELRQTATAVGLKPAHLIRHAVVTFIRESRGRSASRPLRLAASRRRSTQQPAAQEAQG